jgi:hypothetical protein
MGLPTHVVREVFVHGFVSSGKDPNPLFPCGVCENMFKKVLSDVQTKHRGDVTLYMFNKAVSPTQLVVMNLAEISLRVGALFRRFVDVELDGK